jgi:hypothetical protein
MEVLTDTVPLVQAFLDPRSFLRLACVSRAARDCAAMQTEYWKNLCQICGALPPPQPFISWRSTYRQLRTRLSETMLAAQQQQAMILTTTRLFPLGMVEDSTGRCPGAPQVLIAGSVPVRAVLNEVHDPDWRGDIDIFCTWDAAPAVRGRLVAANLICSGANDSYVSCPEEDLITAVDHVEGYAPVPTAGSHHLKSWRSDSLSYSDSTVTPDEFRQRAVQYGREVVNRGWCGHRLNPKSIGLPGGSAGGEFPFDFSLEHDTVIQLIVGKPSCTDARHLLDSFDLTICKTYFDGQSFGIPFPQETMQRQTVVTPARLALVDEYIKATVRVCACAATGADDDGRYYYSREDVFLAMPDAVWTGVGVKPYEKEDTSMESLQAQVDRASKERADPNFDWSKAVPRDRATMDWHARHDFIHTLIRRFHKYTIRGIEILNVPAGVLSFQTEFCQGGDWHNGPTPPRSHEEDPVDHDAILDQ